MHRVGYLLCSGNRKLIQIRFRRTTLDYSEKQILKYLKRTRDYMLVYSNGSFGMLTDFDFQGILTIVKLHMNKT